MSHLPLPEFYRRVAVDAVAANDMPARSPFIVQVKCGRAVITEFAAMGVDSVAVAAEYDGLKGPGQYIRVVPAARMQAEKLATQTLRAEGAFLTQNEAGGVAIVEAGDLSPADLEEIDRQYHRAKVSGQLRQRDDRAALQLQVDQPGSAA